MVRELDVERPWSLTPGECRRAAVEAGMDPEAVGTLTRAFREVRYGERPVTDERRERALRSADRIAGGVDRVGGDTGRFAGGPERIAGGTDRATDGGEPR